MGGFRIGLLGVIALVLLRISVGWHFVTQGMEKYRDWQLLVAWVSVPGEGARSRKNSTN